MESLLTLAHSRRTRLPRGASAPPGVDDLVLDRYRLLECLGAGGFGVVWRAHDELLHREVAVKRVPLQDGEDGERASREALASARLSHPAVVALYEACAFEEAFYLISELVEGDTLARLIAADALSDEEVLEIGLALCSALTHAHARGVIHRDIKPHNVLVPAEQAERSPTERPPGAAKLTDFGGASLAGEEALTRTGDVLGTLAYMAPEQSEGGEVGVQADLYALALVLYEAFSGVNPVRGPTPASTARRIGRPLPPLARHRGELPRELTRALDTALAPSPRERGTLEQLGLAIEDALQRGLQRSRRGLFTRSPKGSRELSSLDVFEEAPAVRRRRLELPRGLWLACALAVVAWQGLIAGPGAALLVLAALVPLALLPRRSGPGWLAAGLAPALGLLGLAGAFPAIAGQATSWRKRVALAALGYWWLTLAQALLAQRLWLGQPARAPARAAWEPSLSSAALHVLGPLLSLGVLLGAALWAFAAMILPWIARGRNAALDVVAVTMWSAALAATAPLLDGGLSGQALHPGPRGATLGAVLGGVLALTARALRGPV